MPEDPPFPAKAVYDGIKERCDYRIVRFVGTINRVDGDTAFISLTDEFGQDGWATLPFAEFAIVGLSEDDDFYLDIEVKNGQPCKIITPIPRRQLTDEEVAQIWAEVSELSDDLESW